MPINTVRSFAHSHLAQTCTHRLALTLGTEALSHALQNVQLVLYGEVDEVCVNKDVVGRPQLVIILEE